MTLHQDGAPAGATTVTRDVPTGVVEGWAAPQFEPVVDEFVRGFHERGELGASLCVVVDGATVVDVWGGTANERTAQPWERDTVAVAFSCTKGVTALCAHLLVARGELDLDAPVGEVWPEYARDGKERTTVRMMLDHSAGVPVLRGELADGELYDWERMVARLEAEPPFWAPGTRNGYHMINFGWTVGELVRRVSGRSLGAFVQDEIARPLGLDLWIGLPEDVEPRVARIEPYRRARGEPLGPFALAVVEDPASIPALALANMGSFAVNSRACRAAEIGGGGGVTNARGLAGMYAALATGGAPLVGPDDVARMQRISVATNLDATLRIPTRFTTGFMVSMDNRRVPGADSAVLGEHAFGHVGAGGSIGMADPSTGLALGYVMNRQGPGILLNERGQAVVDAADAALTAR